MDNNFRRRERRRQAHLERLGTNNSRCVVCGENDPSCLELHHLRGRKFGDELVAVCRNCHRKLSDTQKDHPKPLGSEPSFEECLAHFLLGIADLLELLVRKFRELAQQLLAKLSASSAVAGGKS